MDASLYFGVTCSAGFKREPKGQPPFWGLQTSRLTLTRRYLARCQVLKAMRALSEEQRRGRIRLGTFSWLCRVWSLLQVAEREKTHFPVCVGMIPHLKPFKAKLVLASFNQVSPMMKVLYLGVPLFQRVSSWVSLVEHKRYNVHLASSYLPLESMYLLERHRHLRTPAPTLGYSFAVCNWCT